eukprot:6178564-Pleurochrysis_carterae.AAC.1
MQKSDLAARASGGELIRLSKEGRLRAYTVGGTERERKCVGTVGQWGRKAPLKTHETGVTGRSANMA